MATASPLTVISIEKKIKTIIVHNQVFYLKDYHTERKMRKRKIKEASEPFGSEIMSDPVVNTKSGGKTQISSAFDDELEQLVKLIGKWKYWLFPVVEFCLAFSWDYFTHRCSSQAILGMRGATNQDAYDEKLFWTGIASLFCPLTGFFIDQFTGSYAMGIFNVATHFSLAALFLISGIVHQRTGESIYDRELSEVFFYYFVPVFATNFARIAYAFDHTSTTDPDKHGHLSFLLIFASIAASFVFDIVIELGPSEEFLVFLVFGANGFSLFVFVYILTPTEQSRKKFMRLAAISWGCITTGLSNRIKMRKIIRKEHWLDYADVSFQRVVIARTKVLLRVMLMIVPTMGYLTILDSREGVLENFREKLKYTDHGVTTLGSWIRKPTRVITMLTVQYGILPLTRVLKWNQEFIYKFVFGYLIVVLALFFITISMSSLEKTRLRSNLGIVRIFNTKLNPVNFSAKDEIHLELNFTVAPQSFVAMNFFATVSRLFPAHFKFSNRSSYTRLLFVQPFEVRQYTIVEPDLVIGFRRVLPIKSTHPGYNDMKKPTLLLYNLLRGKDAYVRLDNVITKQTVTIRKSSGRNWVTQVPEGTYNIKLEGNILSLHNHYFGAGGLYMIMVYTNLRENLVRVDVLCPPSTASSAFSLGEKIPFAASYVFSYAPLWSLVYLKSPDGLTGTSLSLLTFAQLVTNFHTFIGQKAWHTYYNVISLTVYSFMMAGYFVVNLCLFLKLKYLYR